VKPLDVELVKRLAQEHDFLVTVEEGCIMGGAGAAVMEALAAAGIAKPVLNLGLPDNFIDQGDPQALLASVGLDAKGIAASIRARLVAQGEPRLVVNNG
jgi:1-deoxy-D-xylulose-5-phosphate synthase